MLVDTHCHLDARQFASESTADVVARAVAAGVRQMVTIGTDEASSARATTIASTHPEVYASAGVDPNDAADWSTTRLDAVAELLRSEKVVAVGEIGLDYYWDRVDRDTQALAFRQQLDLAADTGVPVVIHNREADADTEAILLEWAGQHPGTKSGLLGVMHCFSGSPEMAKRLARAGFAISFAGNVTYPNASSLQAACLAVPGDSLVLETDSPYLSPQSHRGQRNEPARVREIAAFVADLRGVGVEEIAALTTANAARLFGLRMAGEPDTVKRGVAVGDASSQPTGAAAQEGVDRT